MGADQDPIRPLTRSVRFGPRVEFLAVCCLALLARLAFLQLTGWAGQIINNDGLAYQQLATNLLAGNGFAWGPGQATAFRPFGYPWFMTGVYVLAGRCPLAVQLVQTMLGALTAGMVYGLGRRLADRTTGLLAGAGVALHPVLIYSAALMAPEVVAIFLEVALLWFALRTTTAQQVRGADAVGFATVGAGITLVRPELLLVVLLVAAAMACFCRDARVRVLVVAAATLLAVLLGVGPPVLDNWQRFSALIPFPTVGGVTFWGANNPYADGGWLMPLPQYFPAGTAPELGMLGWPGLTEVQSQARFYHIAFDWMRENPVGALSLVPKKLARSWTLSYADEAHAQSLPFWVTGLNAAFGLLILAGIILASRQWERWLLALLLAPVSAWLIKTIVFYGSARQTAPALPVLCIFAAVAVDAARTALLGTRRRRRGLG